MHDIKETASDVVEILREIGTPGVQETFDKIREVAIIGRTEALKLTVNELRLPDGTIRNLQQTVHNVREK